MNYKFIESAFTIIIALVLGAILLQASAVSFDYMKLNKLPLYSSAETLPDYARKMYLATNDMGGQVQKIRQVFEERATIDLTVYEKDTLAKHSITTARMALRNALSSQADLGKLNQADLSFVTTDSFFNSHCSQTQNQQAEVMKAGLDPSAAASPAVDGKTSGGKVWQSLCESFACDSGTIKDTAVRAKMICAQRDLQDVLNRKQLIDGFQYDSAKSIGDLMKMDFPDFDKSDVANAIRVTSSYRAMVDAKDKKPTVPACGKECPNGTIGGVSEISMPAPAWNAWFWNGVFAIPLSVMYLILSFLFGCAGCVSSNLYDVAQPNSKATDQKVLYNIVAGGGSAILVLIITMAGFQFLAAGASSADLSYPNPLVVCGLSVAVGLNGDKVLAALKDWISRIFSGNTSNTVVTPNETPPPVG